MPGRKLSDEKINKIYSYVEGAAEELGWGIETFLIGSQATGISRAGKWDVDLYVAKFNGDMTGLDANGQPKVYIAGSIATALHNHHPGLFSLGAYRSGEISPIWYVVFTSGPFQGLNVDFQDYQTIRLQPRNETQVYEWLSTEGARRLPLGSVANARRH